MFVCHHKLSSLRLPTRDEGISFRKVNFLVEKFVEVIVVWYGASKSKSFKRCHFFYHLCTWPSLQFEIDRFIGFNSTVSNYIFKNRIIMQWNETNNETSEKKNDLQNTRQHEARQRSVYKWVFSCSLKESTETADDMNIGKAFPSVRAMTSKGFWV